LGSLTGVNASTLDCTEAAFTLIEVRVRVSTYGFQRTGGTPDYTAATATERYAVVATTDTAKYVAHDNDDNSDSNSTTTS